MRLVFFIMTGVLMSSMHAQELDRIHSPEGYPEWAHTCYREISETAVHRENENITKALLAMIPWIEISIARSIISGRMVENVSQELVLRKKYISLSKQDIAKFGFDLFSCTAVGSANGKTFSQACSSALNQACAMAIEGQLQRILALRIVNKERNNLYDRLMSLIAAPALMYVSNNYVFPVVKMHSLALLKAILAKK